MFLEYFLFQILLFGFLWYSQKLEILSFLKFEGAVKKKILYLFN